MKCKKFWRMHTESQILLASKNTSLQDRLDQASVRCEASTARGRPQAKLLRRLSLLPRSGPRCTRPDAEASEYSELRPCSVLRRASCMHLRGPGDDYVSWYTNCALTGRTLHSLWHYVLFWTFLNSFGCFFAIFSKKLVSIWSFFDTNFWLIVLELSKILTFSQKKITCWLVLLAHLVHEGNEGVCKTRYVVLAVLPQSMHADCYQHPVAVVQLELAVDVQHKSVRHLREVADPLHLLGSCEARTFNLVLYRIRGNHEVFSLDLPYGEGVLRVGDHQRTRFWCRQSFVLAEGKEVVSRFQRELIGISPFETLRQTLKLC